MSFADPKNPNPGKMNFVSERGHFSGCKVVELADNASALNAYFNENPGLLVVEMIHKPATDSVLLVLSKVLTDEEVQDMNDYATAARELADKRKAVREAAQAEQAVKDAAAAAEEKELIALGRRCRENHGKRLKP